MTQQPLLSSTYMFLKGYSVIYIDSSGNTEVIPLMFYKSRDLLSKRSHCFFLSFMLGSFVEPLITVFL